MPSLACPECGKELLPQDFVPTENELACPQCGRAVYERKKEGVTIICPKCGEEAKSDAFLVVNTD